MITKPPVFTDPSILKDRVQAYFDHCEASKERLELKNGDVKVRQEFPSTVGLAVWLGVHRDTLYSYMNGEEKPIEGESYREITDTLNHARDQIEALALQNAASGDADSRISALILTSMGYSKPESESTLRVVVESADKSALDKYSG